VAPAASRFRCDSQTTDRRFTRCWQVPGLKWRHELPEPGRRDRAPQGIPTPTPVRSWRGLVAGAVAGGVLAASVAVPVTWQAVRQDSGTTTSSASGSVTQTTGDTPAATDPDPDWRSVPDATTPYGGYAGGTTAGGSSATSAGSDATDAESAGVALVDTTLTDGSGAGTGLVLSADGLVLTNYHVVADSTDVQVTIATSGETYDADVVGFDETADVALLQLEGASGLTTATLDDDGGARVDEAVTAIGNAEGQGHLSASSGTVVKVDQPITTSDRDGTVAEHLKGLIETDAYVVPGYSGGALLDAEGEVVGITTAASTGDAVESYAVPIADALRVVGQIEAGTESAGLQIGPSPYLGISVATTSGDVQVAEVEAGGAAEQAGIAAGDTIVGVGGTAVPTLDDLAATLATHEPGDRVRIGWRDSAGTVHHATVTLGESPVN
jgi:S1-C subfamily serine protease